MKLNRRDWLKSSLSLTTGITLTSGPASRLVAAPVSRAEEEFLKARNVRTATVRLDSNENPYGPSQKAKDAIIKVLTEINRYPLSEPEELKLLIAKGGCNSCPCSHRRRLR